MGKENIKYNSSLKNMIIEYDDGSVEEVESGLAFGFDKEKEYFGITTKNIQGNYYMMIVFSILSLVKRSELLTGLDTEESEAFSIIKELLEDEEFKQDTEILDAVDLDVEGA